MRYIEQGTEFVAHLVAAVGLAGVTVSVVDPDASGVALVGPLAATEDPAIPGRYTAAIVAPDAAVDGHAFAIVWDLPTDPSVSEDLIVTVAAPTVNIAALPDVADVAAFLRARTRNRHGVEAGTFTTETRPTRGAVLAIIGLAQADVAGSVGFGTLPDGLARRARSATAIRAAMLVELSFFPEQVSSGRSPYEHLRDMYDKEIERLEAAAAADGIDADGDGVIDAGSGGMPSYRVPDHVMTSFDMEF